METQQISSDIWSIVGNSQGKRFSIEFAQNAFTSAKLAQKVCKGLFNEGIDGAKGTWTELYADTAKPNREGNFDQVKLFVGPDQTPEQRSTLFMLKKIVEACEKVHPQSEFSFWKAKGVVQVIWEGKKKYFPKCSQLRLQLMNPWCNGTPPWFTN